MAGSMQADGRTRADALAASASRSIVRDPSTRGIIQAEISDLRTERERWAGGSTLHAREQLIRIDHEIALRERKIQEIDTGKYTPLPDASAPEPLTGPPEAMIVAGAYAEAVEQGISPMHTDVREWVAEAMQEAHADLAD